MNTDGAHITNTQSETVLPQPGLFSIANQIRYGFLLLIILFLLVTGSVLIWISFQAQQAQLIDAQQERSRAVAGEINAFLDDLQRKLSYLARIQGLADFSPDTQRRLLNGLTRHNDAYEAVAILDDTGQVVTSVSPFGDPISGNLAGTPLFLRSFRQQEDFVGPVEIDPELQVPVVTLAVPIRNLQDEVDGVLLARVNLEFLQFVVTQTEVGQSGYAYVFDNRNFLVAQPGGTQAGLSDLSERSYMQEFVAGTLNTQQAYQGLRGQEVLGAFAPIRSVRWNVGVELPTAEAFAPTRNMLFAMGGGLLLAVVVAVGLGIVLSRQIVIPLQRLTQAASQISMGNLDTQVKVTSRNEMGILASTFNRMTTQLSDLYATLEDKVASRTQRLELVAVMSEQLSSILHVDELMAALVDQIKDQFGYYHAHVYLIDERRQNLVVAAGTGQAGVEMKAKGHSIPIDAPTSLVARAARTRKIVSVDNVRQEPDWLPNPLLPDTYSEMALPILLDNEIVGVLDVQEDRVAGLDEGDANLLRSLANQVAVTIRNARLFEQVETALAEAHAAQERYLEQAWSKTKIAPASRQYLYAQSETAAADPHKQQTLAKIQQQAHAQNQPAVIAPNGDNGEGSSLVAPIALRNKVIGALQVHTGNTSRTWSDEELAMMDVIAQQFAQIAENMRLFDETRIRATRERTIRQITEKMRAATSIDDLVKTAAQELGQHLSAGHAVVELGIEENNGAPANNDKASGT